MVCTRCGLAWEGGWTVESEAGMASAWSMFWFFFSSRRRHTRLTCDWSSDVCSSDLDRVEWGDFATRRCAAKVRREFSLSGLGSHRYGRGQCDSLGRRRRKGNCLARGRSTAKSHRQIFARPQSHPVVRGFPLPVIPSESRGIPPSYLKASAAASLDFARDDGLERSYQDATVAFAAKSTSLKPS